MAWSEDEKRRLKSYAQAAHASIVNELSDDLGVTLLIHDANVSSTVQIVSMTTLPSRRHVRVLLGEAIVGSIQADGHEAETVGALVMDDVASVLGIKAEGWN